MSNQDIERELLRKEIKRDDANHDVYYRIEGLPLPKLVQTKVSKTRIPDDTQAERLLASLKKLTGFVPPIK